MISAIVLIGQNLDKKLLNSCLKSISWCDEIIKVNTQNIKGSFAEWRNEGLKKAKGDWVFYVDTDEEVTQSLRQEITSLITNHLSMQAGESQITCYALPRQNIIFGQEFKHGGQWPDYQKRLFLKSALKKWVGDVHEEPVYEGEIHHMHNSLTHYKNITISQMLDKTNNWSEIEAKLMFEANHPKMNILRFLSAGFREFYLRFIKQLSFLDGPKGIIYGIYQIYSKLISYSKLWEMQLKNEKL